MAITINTKHYLQVGGITGILIHFTGDGSATTLNTGLQTVYGAFIEAETDATARTVATANASGTVTFSDAVSDAQDYTLLVFGA